MMRLASAMYSSHVCSTRRRPGIGGSQSGSCRRRRAGCLFAGGATPLVLLVAELHRTPALAFAFALAQHVDHDVEGARELADLVVGAHGDVRLVVVARLEGVRRGGEPLDRSHDAAREE